MSFLLGCLVGLAGYLWVVYRFMPNWPQEVALSPDGQAYLEMARGELKPRTYHVRWLLPWILGDRPRAWQVVTSGSLVIACGMLAQLATNRGFPIERALFAAALLAGLPLFRICVTLPILADGPALLCLISAVALDDIGDPWLALAFVLVGSSIRETVGPMAFAATLDPWFLLGALVPIGRFLLFRRSPDEPSWATRPFSYARAVHRPHLTLGALVLPWGAALLGLALWPLPLALVLSLLMGYGAVWLAHDVVRNYQWAFLPLVLAAAAVAPSWALVGLVVVHWLNPYAGEL